MDETAGWKLFWEFFKEGDEVVVIDDNDVFHVGKLKECDDYGFSLGHPGKRDERLKWIRTRFISHDGFPAERLLGADGSESILKIDTKDSTKRLRHALTHDICKDCKEIVEATKENREWGHGFFHRKCARKRSVGTIVGGHPFILEGIASASIVNPGNSGPEHYEEDTEEVVILETSDGATGLLYDLPTVFFWE
jgi:hypothetical protein